MLYCNDRKGKVSKYVNRTDSNLFSLLYDMLFEIIYALFLYDSEYCGFFSFQLHYTNKSYSYHDAAITVCC